VVGCDEERSCVGALGVGCDVLDEDLAPGDVGFNFPKHPLSINS
jgi:hypothetical protein